MPQSLKILITAGPTHEPIDSVRYIGNRSSGRMGAALAAAALRLGHVPSLILGPVTVPMPDVARLDVQTAQQMFQAVMEQFPAHDLLIMAAAVADFRPKKLLAGKIPRQGWLSIECRATADILAAVGRVKRPNQRTVGFSLENPGQLQRARRKLLAKKLDLIVYNPIATIGADSIESVLLYPDGRRENLPSRSKAELADILIRRSVALFN